MQLAEIVRELGAAKVEGPLLRQVAGLTYDSRRVTPGMVFVAVPGLNVDGHDFIATAVERGAAAVICERNGFIPHRATKIRVPDSREALARAAATFYEHPSTELKVIGITGTNGKTTVAFMLRQILEQAGARTGLVSTIHYEIGERVIPANRTTPEALEIQQMLAAMLRARCHACVMEVSSHALDQKRVVGVEFDAAVFTNLTEDHLDYHQNLEAYYSAKKGLFDQMRASAKQGASVINIDDAFGGRLAGETSPEVQLTYGLGEAARLRASSLRVGREATEMVIEGPDVRFECRLPLIGRHNVYNALAAIGAALALKVPQAAIETALRTLKPVPGRLERICQGQPFGLFVDYAHTPEALRQMLVTLRELTPGRVLLAFGCGGSRDVAKRAKMGRVAAELADLVVITSDNPRRESPQAIAAQIEEGYCSVRAEGCRVELDRREAIEQLIHSARPGDTVLIAGKGHETYQEFEDTVIPFDDRGCARESLEALGFGRPPEAGET